MFVINYHNITKDDMLNGSGLRVVLWVSGCEHHCSECQNKQTWDVKGGIPFDETAIKELFHELENTYVDGITFSGGDPLHPENLEYVIGLCKRIKTSYPKKTIWLYTGYTFEDIYKLLSEKLLPYIDVLVDGEFVKELEDINYHWAGSTNQRVIDVQKTLKANKIVLLEE